jgi:hypothetical protein
MKNFIIPILILTLTFLNSCKLNREMVSMEITNNQSAVLISENNIEPIKPGLHEISKKDKVITVNRLDSIQIGAIEVYDVDFKSLSCNLKFQYSIDSEQLINIVDLARDVYIVERYKIVVIAEIKDPIREMCSKSKKDNLLADNSNIIQDLKEVIIKDMDKYINITELSIQFSE